MNVQRTMTYSMAAVLAFAMCGLPEAIQAQEPSSQPSTQQQQQRSPANSGVTVNPAQGPLTPPPATEQQQPVATPETTPTTSTTTPNGPQPQQQQGQREPLGAAAAGGVTTAGGGASRPAGTAIAPAKQRQVRSFLIKLGAIAAAGAAIGTVYALSKGTPSTPPNSGR